MSRLVDDASMQVDTYLDELLATRSRHVAAVAEASAELAHAAAVVRDALVRFHPSFRFEEALAARLRGGAMGTAGAPAIVRFPPSGVAAPAVGGSAPGSPSATDRDEDPTPAERGWVLVGGAIASGVSLVAGVLLARRRSRGDHHWERLA